MEKLILKIFGIMLFFVTMISLFAVCSSASVYTGSCGENLTYIFDTYDNSLTIDGNGDMTDFESKTAAPWNAANYFVHKLYLSNGVTSIGDFAFYGTGIVEVVIPENVEKIGKSAFCLSSLRRVELPVAMDSIGEYAFANCFYLEAIRIPKGITEIETGLFSRCEKLTEIATNGEIRRVADYAFCDCKSLQSISFSDDLEYIGKESFRSCDELSSLYVESIEGWLNVKTEEWYSHPLGSEDGKLYVDDSLVIDLVIPDGIEKIRGYAFNNCRYITSVTIGKDVKSIGSYAFWRCKGILSVYIPEGVEKFEYYTFGECISLKGITLPSTLESIGHYSFEGCKDLEYAIIKDGVTEIGVSSFSYCSSLEYIEIPMGVTLIDRYAFEGCSALKNLSLPKSLQSIGCDAFYGAGVEKLYLADLTSWFKTELEMAASHPLYEKHGEIFVDGIELKNVVVPEEIVLIRSFTFYGCLGIENVIFHRNVVSIYDEAFSKCENLTNVSFLGRNTDISSGGFYDCVNLKTVCLLSSGLVDSYFHDGYEKIYLYEMIFDANGGENAPNPIIKYPDEDIEICENFPERENYAFAGWSDGETVYFPGDIYSENEDILLFAIWERKTVDVYFIDGVTDDTIDILSVKVGTNLPLPCEVDKYGYIFEGWYTDKYHGEVIDSDYVVEGEEDLYFFARFSPIVLNSVSIPLGEMLFVCVGDSIVLDVNLYPTDALNKNLIWSSSDLNVVSVDENGRITALAEGEADIIVVPQAGSGSATCRIVVKEINTDPDSPSDNPNLVGDINSDGEISIRDAVIFAQYFAGWNISINMNVADCNSDGKVNIKDMVLLAQYLAKWNVILGG